MLRARFQDFAKETESTGRERISKLNFHADKLIKAHHGNSATIAEWKDAFNEAWADLLELIETRTQMLNASWKLHRFFYDCTDVLGRIIVIIFFVFITLYDLFCVEFFFGTLLNYIMDIKNKRFLYIMYREKV